MSLETPGSLVCSLLELVFVKMETVQTLGLPNSEDFQNQATLRRRGLLFNKVDGFESRSQEKEST